MDKESDLAREASRRRVALSDSLAQLRVQLRAPHLAHEASAQIGETSSKLAATLLSKAKTPAAIAAAGVAAAVAAIALSRAPKASSAAAGGRASSPIAGGPRPIPAGAAQQASPPSQGTLRLALIAATAVAVGVGLNRIIPVSAEERKLIDGVGGEIREAVDQWARAQSSRLVQPAPGEPVRLLNIAAAVIGLVSAVRKPQ